MNRNSLNRPLHITATVHAGLVLLLVLGSAGCDWSHKTYRSPTAPVIPTQPPPQGPVATVDRDVRDFHAVALEGVGTVLIDHGASESLRITADEAMIPYLTSAVSAGMLVLGMDSPYTSHPPDQIEFDVTVMNLDRLELTGVGAIKARHIDTTNLSARMVGVGEIRTNGRVDRQEIELSGTGGYRGENLTSRETHVDIRGVNTAVVRVSERLEGFVGGLAVLEYYGDPVVDIRGTGTVRRLGP